MKVTHVLCEGGPKLISSSLSVTSKITEYTVPVGGNHIAANYWALKALELLQEIEECCTQ